MPSAPRDRGRGGSESPSGSLGDPLAATLWAGRTGGNAPGEDGALKWGETIVPLHQMMPTQGNRRREGGQITGTLQTLLFLLLCPWTSRAGTCFPCHPGHRAELLHHLPAMRQQQCKYRAEHSLSSEYLWALGGNFLLHRNFQTCPLVPER